MRLEGARVFITGGAGFIGSALARRLAGQGSSVRIYDSLLPQVHGPSPHIDLPAEVVRGDVRDRDAFEAAMQGFQPDIVVHLAAETGTGQSADEPTRYAAVNVVGTAHLIEIVRRLAKSPSRIVLAGTRAVYGEGAYLNGSATLVVPEPRRPEDMAAGRFDLYDADGAPLTAAATPEHVGPRPGSVYGSTKLMQEYLLSQAPLPSPWVILRLQNVYGPGQSLRNPYTGVLSIFCQQALEGRVLNIYEDGEIFRDFVFIDDVAAAFVAACREDKPLGRVINIGSGKPTSIREAAELILARLGAPRDRLTVTGAYRAGDVRYAVADTRLAAELLGWSAASSFEDGVALLADWAKSSL